MANDEWSQWGELWKQQPVVDEALWRRAASRKRLRMQGMVALELLLTSVATGQVLWLFSLSTLRWRVWCALSLIFMLTVQALYVHIRRGTWQASGSDMQSMVALTIRRAKAGIRLARLNAWGTLAWVAVTAIVSIPELNPARWQHDAKLRLTLVLQLAVNGPFIVALIAFCLWYVRRQRKRIVQANALLEQLQE